MHSRTTPHHNIAGEADTVPGLGYAVLSAVAATSALIAAVLEHTTPVRIGQAAYILAVAAFVVGTCGYLVRSAETRVRRDLAIAMDHLIDRVDEAVRDAPPTVAHLPRPTRPEGQRLIAVGGEGDAVRTTPSGLDPDTIAAARRISDRLQGRKAR